MYVSLFMSPVTQHYKLTILGSVKSAQVCSNQNMSYSEHLPWLAKPLDGKN